MSQEQLLIPNGKINPVTSVMSENFVPIEPLKSLVAKSIATLEAILSDPNISVQDRAAVALKILAMAETSGSIDLKNLISVQPQNTSTSAQTIVSQPQTILQSNNIQPFIVTAQSSFLPAQYLQIDDFLSPEENKNLLKLALHNSSNFVSSTTSSQEVDYRKSAVLYAEFYPAFYDLIRKKVLQALPAILKQVNHPPFLVSEVEMQMTAHNDGCYYKIHNDSGSSEVRTREFTYVYYFCKEPAQFSGGELRLYDTDLQDSSLERTDDFKIIEPRNNSIVFFDSRLKHEVISVSCPSRKFENSRFTINGWLRRVEV